jgi:hypothetical protein
MLRQAQHEWRGFKKQKKEILLKKVFPFEIFARFLKSD